MAVYTFGTSKQPALLYKNDFGGNSIKDMKVIAGEMEVRDGVLRATKAGDGYADALLNIPKTENFVLEVDFINHQGGGGVFFGAASEEAKKSIETNGHPGGYYAFVSEDGTTAAFGCAGADGAWSGNFTSGRNAARFAVGQDLHLYIRACGDYIIYTISDCKNGEELYRAEYRKGDCTRDCGPFDGGAILLRLNNDGGRGGFANLKIYGFNAVEMSDITLGVSEKLTTKISPEKRQELIVFANDGVGYALGYDAAVERLVAYTYRSGELSFIAQHAMKLTAGRAYDFAVVNSGKVLSVYLGDATWPVIDIQTAGAASYKVGSSAPLGFEIAATELYSGATYKNPVTDGADPEILYYDGTFYLYTLTHDETCRVRVRTSKNLYEWEEAGFAFELNEHSPIHYFMSPNVFHKDGWFYLLIASRLPGDSGPTEFRIFYASARSPLGPFVMNPEKPYINTEREIGGAPFVDDDGRVYITTVRFGGGNHIYIQELNAEDGVLSSRSDAVLCIAPTEHYEIDEYGAISEGGVIVKHGGYYYMMYASGHYKGHYGEAYAVSKELYGPYTKYKYNEIISFNKYVDGVGDCMFVNCPELEEMYVVYHKHAVIGNLGRQRDVCIDRYYFVPNEDGGPDVLRVYGPTDTPVPAPKFKKTK
ncbi:MAG: family 43 glycosylhydrolase [Clostridia bacterium]|nr:family 43 glycosylhydrolase [Clostridia bacterium]